jgi:hypothetical protein
MNSRDGIRGLDGRHRDADGTISRKHGNTRLDSLRPVYGDDFGAPYRGDMHLDTLLKQSGSPSLSQYMKKHK